MPRAASSLGNRSPAFAGAGSGGSRTSARTAHAPAASRRESSPPRAGASHARTASHAPGPPPLSRGQALAPRLGRVPVVRAPVGVQARRQLPTLNHLRHPSNLRHPSKARRGPLLLDEEHRIVLTGRIVERDDEVPMPRRPLPAPTVLASPRRLRHHTRPLKGPLHLTCSCTPSRAHDGRSCRSAPRSTPRSAPGTAPRRAPPHRPAPDAPTPDPDACPPSPSSPSSS